jgi:hypothetical protein
MMPGSRLDRWALRLTVFLAYSFMLIAVCVTLFPRLGGVGEGWALVLLGLAELFLLLRAYIAFRVNSALEGTFFVAIFLMVLVAMLIPVLRDSPAS